MSEPTLNFQIQTSSTQFKVPTELMKKNLKSIQKLIEKQKKQATNDISNIQKNPDLPASLKLEMTRKLIKGFENFQKRLNATVKKDEEYRSRLTARLENLEKLAQFTISTQQIVDKTDSDKEESETATKDAEEVVKAEKPSISSDDKVLDLHQNELINWYRDQANLLIIDYLIKSNITTGSSVGLNLLKSLSVSNPQYMKLIDYDIFDTFNKVFMSIVESHDLNLVTSWFEENRTSLKKISSNLEFEISYCRFLSFIEQGKTDEAISFSHEHLSPSGNISNYQKNEMGNYETNLKKLKEIGGLLVYLAIDEKDYSGSSLSRDIVKRSSRFQDYKRLLSSDRWRNVSDCFVDDFTKLYGISKNYPLFIYLSAGLSSLKTKSCYCNTKNTIFQGDTPATPSQSSKDKILRGPNYYYQILHKINNCPVCSPELYKLSRNLPYAQLITNIFNNPYRLPNGNIYPMDKLTALEKPETSQEIWDPLTSESFKLSDCVRVYPA